MKRKPFLYELSNAVKMVESNEEGTVIGRAEYQDHINSYLVRYRAGDGRQVENWFDETAIKAA
ncbi:hypothetical protein ACVW1C_000163 [Bradyrhizobium sp. USDA 4011]|uniref:hypothetical protein n=1 Tax=Bradyrhizobium sp. 41S5 TaxID=1404443 RepID=UPI00156A99EF|nr:hypothetical protein [Bradyrhizobium sp. 41S5]UFX42116.1 hypothetical protein HAP47_0022925 [Bradyrhizobium sp. 41S5]